jgi:glycosyltransferase involved in cell wall biosynthesis
MLATPIKVLMGFYFFPRGGSAHACGAIARELQRHGIEVELLAGSRSDRGELADAEDFFAGVHTRAVDVTPALGGDDPVRFRGGEGTAPMHGSYEDRAGAPDPVLASLDQEAFERQVEAWGREMRLAGAGEADVLYLHHLTPLNEAAAREFPGTPVIGHIHGSELLMLERLTLSPPAGWIYGGRWAQRLSEWAAGCARIVVNSPEGLKRASHLLDIDPDRFVLIPNGFPDDFAPSEIDRSGHWRRQLVERPQGWRPSSQPGSVRYEEAELEALGGTVLVAVGRFTEVKRLPLLIEAYGRARPRFDDRTALVLVGGYPGEWEGEHPLETIERLSVPGVFLAGWHPHESLPDFFNAADLFVHPSVHEQFGLVLVEAMACGIPVIAVNRGGPAMIVDDPRTGWLVPPDDAGALADAMVEAVNDPEARRLRGRSARAEAADRYSWERIGAELADLVGEVSAVRNS